MQPLWWPIGAASSAGPHQLDDSFFGYSDSGHDLEMYFFLYRRESILQLVVKCKAHQAYIHLILL